MKTRKTCCRECHCHRLNMVPRRRLRFMIALFCTMSLAMCLVTLSVSDPSLLLQGFLQGSAPKSCACQPCIVEQDNDTWFYEKLNLSIQPLLTRDNTDMSNDTFSWWMWLQIQDNPSNLSGVLDKLFHTIPGEETYMDGGPTRCRTCAVVGNSGNLHSSHYGQLIDTNDFVIRINQGPTEGYEKDVGYRTTHHVMYPESAKHLNVNTSLLLVPFKILDIEWLISALTTGHITDTYQPVLTQINASRNKAMVFTPTFIRYVHLSWLEGHGRYPSTGFITVIFALHICDKVNVFGFGADQQGNWHHYWERNIQNSAFRETGVHDADHEHSVIQMLDQRGKITLHKGATWPLFTWNA